MPYRTKSAPSSAPTATPPKLGRGRKRPDQKTRDWQKLLVDHGYVGRTIPREYGGDGVYTGMSNRSISLPVVG